MRILPTLVLLAVLAPLANAALPTAPATYVFPTGGSVSLDVTYADGLGSTKFGFEQLGGRTGGPSQRLVAGALCTEWDGTFTQVLVRASAADNAASARLNVLGAAVATAPPTRDSAGFTFDALGGPGAWEGVLLVCDDAAGVGSIHFAATLARTPVVGADPAVIRLTEA